MIKRVDELELESFDYTDPAMRGERFHGRIRELRERGWLASGPFGYLVLDHEAGEFFLRSRSAIFPGMKIAEIFGVADGPLYEEMRRNILHINGPDHARLRGLVGPAFSPRAVERFRPAMREILEGLLGAVEDRGAGGGGGIECEFVEELAKPYPSRVIATVMGAPLRDAPRLHHWSNWIQRQFDAVSMLEERPAIERAVAEFYEYAGALVRARRGDPSDDLISALIAASDAGEGGDGEGEDDRLSDVECVNLVVNVLAGGVDTTQSQLAHAIRLFAENPEQWERLRSDRGLVEHAVEEVLRFEPITPFTARILTEEVVFRDVVFPEGTIVMVCAFTANRELDEGESDRFDIAADRPRARALTFGAGIHYCLGANLARAELGEALALLAARVEKLELAGEPTYEGITGIYGLAAIPVRFSFAAT